MSESEMKTVTRLVDGQWQVFQRRASGRGPTHGLASTYKSRAYACRCQPCRDAHAAFQKREDRQRRERLAADSTLVEHGLVSTYINWGCRCEECSAAHSARLKSQRASRFARLAADPSIREHGNVNTYSAWGCRCEACKTAASVAQRQKRAST